MEQDAYWRAFARTGDPVYYLLHKALLESAAYVNMKT